MNEILTTLHLWLIEHPERIYAMSFIVVTFQYYIMYLAKQKPQYKSKRIVYCNGSKSKIVFVRMVTQQTFDYVCNHLDNYSYGVIDVNSCSIYFDITYVDKIGDII